ncbi:MAG: gp58-like family protein [Gammaproteobacteria bacterium]|nr:gp58-like family protein [Gammaproteobacteria bacterium]MBU2678217.1 gp58-like family protein [Gammaproteobacteria bacterium]NNL51952.1 hypothetical protein [Woeseiaceae bacterium]
MASLVTLFKSETTDTQETDKLVDLFRNRVELKKEFAALRNEKYRLQDRIKQHQGATARVQQQLQHLENLLLDTEWVNTVVVFYQLRGLAAHCNDKLSCFAEQIKQQREQRVQSKVLLSWNEQRKRKSDRLESRMSEHRMTMQLMEDRLQSERHKLLTMNGFVKLFRGRSLAAQIDDLTSEIETARCEEQELLRDLEAIDKLAAPDHKGLDISAKRSVNFMILSFAQHLYLQFEEDNLVELAKEASEKSVGAINYGAKPECDILLKRLEKRKKEAEEDHDFADVLQKRAKLIAKHAEFRHDDDAVPVPSTVATIFAIDGSGVVHQQEANLLGNNYFGIAKVLSR